MTPQTGAFQRVRVLIVDDSAMARKVLALGLGTDPMIEVVGSAASAEQAFEMVKDLRPDVMTLDIEMPRIDGVSFLRQLMPVIRQPTVVISSSTQSGAAITLQALEAGAVDIIAKPSLGVGGGLAAIMNDICVRVRAAARARPVTIARHSHTATSHSAANGGQSKIIAIGASTGGVQALTHVFQELPAQMPGIVVVQHMPAGFTDAFARRMDGMCALHIREAVDGDIIRPGTVLIAPGGTKHMTVVGVAPHWRISMIDSDPVCFSRPSVDVLFKSVARVGGKSVCAALLTGMGRDGANGMLAIRKAGGRTIAQDEATSVVWGMPAAAVELGAAQAVLPLEAIPREIQAAAAPAVSAAKAASHFPQQGTAR